MNPLLYIRIVRWLSRRLDLIELRYRRKDWKPTGADGACDEWCSFCGIRCPHCGRP